MHKAPVSFSLSFSLSQSSFSSFDSSSSAYSSLAFVWLVCSTASIFLFLTTHLIIFSFAGFLLMVFFSRSNFGWLWFCVTSQNL